MASLDGKVALVTGGASGIGLATVQRLLAEGTRVVIADRQGPASDALKGGGVAFAPCDVTVEADIAAAVDLAVSTFGGLDILFNNAGAGGVTGGIEGMNADAWDATFALLLRAPMLGIRYALPHMRRAGGGVIVNTASIAGKEAGWGPLAYSVAKAGLMHLTTCVAAELGRSNIRVNAILPGLIATQIFAAGNPERARMLQGHVAANAQDIQPIPVAGAAEDIANAVVFLCSPDARFITGALLPVDGGLSTGRRHAWDPATISPVRKLLDV